MPALQLADIQDFYEWNDLSEIIQQAQGVQAKIILFVNLLLYVCRASSVALRFVRQLVEVVVNGRLKIPNNPWFSSSSVWFTFHFDQVSSSGSKSETTVEVT